MPVIGHFTIVPGSFHVTSTNAARVKGEKTIVHSAHSFHVAVGISGSSFGNSGIMISLPLYGHFTLVPDFIPDTFSNILSDANEGAKGERIDFHGTSQVAMFSGRYSTVTVRDPGVTVSVI